LLQQGDHGKPSKQQSEEEYEKKYGKMGRDFVHIDDLNAWIDKMRIVLGPLGLAIPPISQDRAIARGLQYRNVVESGEDGSKKFTDLVIIEQDEEEDDEE